MEYVDIDNFTHGIYNRPTSDPNLLGAAQEDGTYGCYGGIGGGLFPLPKPLNSRTIDFDFIHDAAVPQNYPYHLLRQQILDTALISPLYYQTNFVGHPGAPRIYLSDNPDELQLIIQGYLDVDSGGVYRREVFGITYMEQTGQQSVQATAPGAREEPVVQYLFDDSGTGVAQLSPHPSRFQYGGSAAGIGIDTDPSSVFIDWPTPAIYMFAGPFRHATIIAGGDPFVQGWFRSTHVGWGRLTGPVRTHGVIRSVAHQGQVWFAPMAIDSLSDERPGIRFGASGAMYVAQSLWGMDGFGASDITNLRSILATVKGFTGVGAMASLTTSYLLAITHHSGGVLYRNDLAQDSEAQSLYNLPGTYMAIHTPVQVENSVIYGSRNGVYRVEAGSDSASLISPQLDGFFWNASPDTDLLRMGQGAYGKFCYVHPWVLLPNNWVLDIRTGSWWRLSDPDSLRFIHYEYSQSGRIYAIPAFLSPEQTTAFIRFDTSQATDSYSFRSQPIQLTRNRNLKYREMVAKLQGRGEVTISLFDMNGDEQTTTFSIDSDQPLIQKKSIGFYSPDCILTITSTATTPSLPAPATLRVSLGYDERMAN